MGIRSLRIDTTDSFSLAGTNVIPVLNNAPTLTGFSPSSGPAAALVTLSDLATYFGGGGGVTWPLFADSGTSGAPSYAFSVEHGAGIYWDPSFECVTVVTPTPGSAGLNVLGSLQVGDAGTYGELWVFAADGGRATIGMGVSNPSDIRIGQAASTLGFYGANAITQQVLATGALATVDDVITFLQTIGLCKQS